MLAKEIFLSDDNSLYLHESIFVNIQIELDTLFGKGSAPVVAKLNTEGHHRADVELAKASMREVANKRSNHKSSEKDHNHDHEHLPDGSIDDSKKDQ